MAHSVAVNYWMDVILRPLFELGRLTSGQAAQMAGMTRVDLLLETSRYGSPSVVWDKEEIVREFEQ